MNSCPSHFCPPAPHVRRHKHAYQHHGGRAAGPRLRHTTSGLRSTTQSAAYRPLSWRFIPQNSMLRKISHEKSMNSTQTACCSSQWDGHLAHDCPCRRHNARTKEHVVIPACVCCLEVICMQRRPIGSRHGSLITDLHPTASIDELALSTCL